MHSFVTKHTKANDAFGIFMAAITGVVALLSICALAGLIDLQDVVSNFSHREKTLFHVSLISEALSTPTALYMAVLAVLLVVLGVLLVQLRKKRHAGILYAVLGAWLMCNVLLDAVALPAFKDGTSIKPFIHEIKDKYPLKKGNMYVVNDLRKYINLYGPNFYLNNGLMRFETVKPEAGFFLSTDKDIEKVKDTYKDYWFELLDESPNRFNDTGAVVQIYTFGKTGAETISY